MSSVPRSFRRESRLFLWVALLLVLFLNLLTLILLRAAVEWGTGATERKASELLRRVSFSSRPDEIGDAMERAAIEPDVLFVGAYDQRGRRLRHSGQDFQAPAVLATARPGMGTTRHEWRRQPSLLLSTFAHPEGFYAVAVDPGPGATLRSLSRSFTWLVPLAGAALVILAGFYLRSLLAPYDRLLAAAGAAPPGGSEHQDERDFVIRRFEATVSALSEKERELQRLARAEKHRADDLETAARTLARNLPTGLLSIGPDGRVVELNEAGREILRLPPEVRGESFSKALAAVGPFREIVRETLENRSVVGRREVECRTGSELRVLGVTATPAEGADGRFLGVMALFTDLTEIRRLEARVALARRLADLGEVSAGAAHEFRNSAAAIDGFADLAQRQPDRAAEHLRRIRSEAQQMARITSDFLLFARPEEFLPEPVELESVVQAAIAETEVLFPRVTVEPPGELPQIQGSPALLRRALSNLLRNAVEATPPERRGEAGAIQVSSGRSPEGEVTLAVGDRGAGVPPDLREKIFLPFYSTKGEGAGLGLAIVARIAELHGGTVDVEPRSGGGAIFTLRLPVSAPPPGTRTPQRIPDPRSAF
ncbi:MAG: nitrogen regulation protein NR(II) [Thermoanaerobaculia bacterium]